MVVKAWFLIAFWALGFHAAQPSQGTPSRTQATLPEGLESASRFLLAHGIGDPRGGRFVEAVVKPAGRGGVDTALGWLVPPMGGGSARLVALDGSVLTPLRVQRSVDLKRTIDERVHPNRPTFRGPVSDDDDLVLVALLLVQGEKSLEEEVYRTLPPSDEPVAFVRLANAYLAPQFLDLVRAHEFGNDVLTVSKAKALQRDRVSYEGEARRRLGKAMASTDTLNGKPMVFGYLEPLDALRRDSERRLRERPRPTLDFTKSARLPAAKRIRLLIANLDQVSARQISEPGMPTLGDDPIVRALIAEGPNAIDPLREVRRTDDRLTRSVSFWRSFVPDRHPVTVREVADYALSRIR